jgi:uncharacterized membrane protein required for colicin V production
MLAIFCLALILGIIFFQGVQGLFSALIMALCTLAVTLVAFTYFEPLAALLYKYVDPRFAQPVCLVLLTFVPLITLRFVLDKFLPGNVVPTVWMDRIAGGAFGVVTALLLTGVWAIAVQMLPWVGGVALGYQAFDDNLGRSGSFLVDAPTSFTLGTVKLMSSGSGLRGTQSFASLHDDLAMEMWAAANCDEQGGAPAQKSWRGDEIKIPIIRRNSVKPGCLNIQKVVDATKEMLNDKSRLGTRAAPWPMDNTALDGRSRVFVARVNVTKDAADEDQWWRLRATQFRLVTRDGGSFYPVGYLLRKGGWSLVEDANGIGRLEVNRKFDKEPQLTVDWVYRVPNLPGDQGREPWFMSFRRIAEAPIGHVADGMPGGGGLEQRSVVGSVIVRQPPNSAKGGFILQTIRADVMAELPVPFGWAGSREGEFKNDTGKIIGHLKGGSLLDGSVTGTQADLFKTGSRVEQFYQPAGRCVMRLSCTPPTFEAVQKFQALKGLVFAPSVDTQEGPTYRAVGAWAKWKEGNAETDYMFFSPEPNKDLGMDITGLTGSGGGPFAPFTKIITDKANQLTDCGLLFLVPADATIVSFSLAENTPPSMCDSPMKVSQ